MEHQPDVLGIRKQDDAMVLLGQREDVDCVSFCDVAARSRFDTASNRQLPR
jgi:hypothetical protein